MLKIHDEAQVIFAEMQAIDEKYNEAFNKIELIMGPQEQLNKVFFQYANDHSEDLNEFYKSIMDHLNSLKSAQTTELNDYIKDVTSDLEKLKNKNEINDTWEFLEEITSIIDNQYEVHCDELVTSVVLPSLKQAAEDLMEQRGTIQTTLKTTNNNIDKYQSINKLKLDFDEDYNLTKISKKSEAIPFSVLYLKNGPNGDDVPYALYKGKDKILGIGGFGSVKLCQNLETGGWHAIKIQEAIMKQPSKTENEVLTFFNRFNGEASREGKYYSVQTLLEGKNLFQHLDANQVNLEEKLEIAKQAISLIDSLHSTHLHRDIKPENFIWDPELKELHLSDFGLTCDISNNGNYVDISGSGTSGYLAPEIDKESGHATYTKMTDIYALGRTLEDLFVDTPVSNSHIKHDTRYDSRRSFSKAY